MPFTTTVMKSVVKYRKKQVATCCRDHRCVPAVFRHVRRRCEPGSDPGQIIATPFAQASDVDFSKFLIYINSRAPRCTLTLLIDG